MAMLLEIVVSEVVKLLWSLITHQWQKETIASSLHAEYYAHIEGCVHGS